ncbi:MAG TPA: hypothetical protein VMG10_12245 [Gemmataceae bacterium]|nr:hypothetical protein [Gemmataceae bacterium]
MTTPKKPTRQDGFDALLEEYRNSTDEYEDHDADLRDVLRPWSQLSAEGKLGYIARDAALYNVSFERFEQAARDAIDNSPLPAGERAYLRMHLEYQRALWDPELPAFPREHPLPANDPHREFLDSLDGVLHVKFERLLDDYLNSTQPFADADGQMRRWPALSAEGKVQHIARLAAIFGQPLSRFTEAVHDALDGQPLRTDEHGCLRLCYEYARQIRDSNPYPLPLAQNAQPHADSHEERSASENPQSGLLNETLNVLSEMTAQFETKHLAEYSYAEATIATGLLEAARSVIARANAAREDDTRNTLRDELFSQTKRLPEPEHGHERQHKR